MNGVVGHSISGRPSELVEEVLGLRWSHHLPLTQKDICRNQSECDGYVMVWRLLFNKPRCRLSLSISLLNAYYSIKWFILRYFCDDSDICTDYNVLTSETNTEIGVQEHTHMSIDSRIGKQGRRHNEKDAGAA